MSRSGQGSAILMILVALICLLVLLLPLEGESSGWPSYIHATVNQKLIAAFALGILADTHTEIECKICELKASVFKACFSCRFDDRNCVIYFSPVGLVTMAILKA